MALIRSASGICVLAAQASLNCLSCAHLKCFVFGNVNIVLIYISHIRICFYNKRSMYTCMCICSVLW